MTKFEIALLLESLILLALLIYVGRMYKKSIAKPKLYKFTAQCLGVAGLSLVLIYGIILGQHILYHGRLLTSKGVAPVHTYIYDRGLDDSEDRFSASVQ